MNAPLTLALEPEINLPGVSLHTHVINRCNRWGSFIRWSDYAGIFEAGPKPIRSWWGPVVLNGNVQQNWRDYRENGPVNAEEALETDKAIRRLPLLLMNVMIAEHVVRVKTEDGKRYRDPSQQEKADLCEVSRTTYWRKRDEAYGLLLGLMNDVAAGI